MWLLRRRWKRRAKKILSCSISLDGWCINKYVTWWNGWLRNFYDNGNDKEGEWRGKRRYHQNQMIFCLIESGPISLHSRLDDDDNNVFHHNSLSGVNLGSSESRGRNPVKNEALETTFQHQKIPIKHKLLPISHTSLISLLQISNCLGLKWDSFHLSC